jgi:hypothetical protein
LGIRISAGVRHAGALIFIKIQRPPYDKNKEKKVFYFIMERVKKKGKLLYQTVFIGKNVAGNS